MQIGCVTMLCCAALCLAQCPAGMMSCEKAFLVCNLSFDKELLYPGDYSGCKKHQKSFKQMKNWRENFDHKGIFLFYNRTSDWHKKYCGTHNFKLSGGLDFGSVFGVVLLGFITYSMFSVWGFRTQDPQPKHFLSILYPRPSG